MKMKWRGIIFIALAVCFALFSSLQAAEPLPDTGQTKCFDESGAVINPCPAPGAVFYGQDAQYNSSERQHSYTKLKSDGTPGTNPDGSWSMVKDNVTNLIWEVKTNDGSIHDRDDKYTWSNAQSVFIADLNSGSGYCGHSDWRMPTIKELSLLVDSDWSGELCMNTEYFPQTQSDYYWSSTTYVRETLAAWFIYCDDGGIGPYAKSDRNYVRAVRSGQ